MELNYEILSKKPTLLKQATGLNIKDFDTLFVSFKKCWDNYMQVYTFEGKPRERIRTTRVNSTFKAKQDMLIFILYDYRHNPTQDFMGLHFDLTQPKVAQWIKVLEPLLLKSLQELGMLPARTSDKMDRDILQSVTLLLDGSEREINRPKYEQKQYYSGKKNGTL